MYNIICNHPPPPIKPICNNVIQTDKPESQFCVLHGSVCVSFPTERVLVPPPQEALQSLQGAGPTNIVNHMTGDVYVRVTICT